MKKNKKLLTVVLMCTFLVLSLMSYASASSGSTEGLEPFITAISGSLGDFSTSNLGKVIVAGLAIAVPLVLCWFGFRWIYRKAKGALKRGS